MTGPTFFLWGCCSLVSFFSWLGATVQQPFFLGTQAFYPQNTMHKPDRIRGLVVALIVFSLYVGLANILTSLALASLPLGTVGSVWVGSTAIVTLTLFDAVIMNLYLIRQRKRARTSPSLQ